MNDTATQTPNNEPEPLPSAAGEDEMVIDIGDISDIESDEEGHVIPSKKAQDFYVEFVEFDKKKHIGADNIGDWVKSVHFGQLDVSLAEVKKKKKRPTQDEMPWTVKVVFFDDPANNAADFIEVLKAQEEPIRLRIHSVNEQGKYIETFILKPAVLTHFPRSYRFDITDGAPRVLELEFRADEMRRKSVG
jgi:hypothetical protein